MDGSPVDRGHVWILTLPFDTRRNMNLLILSAVCLFTAIPLTPAHCSASVQHCPGPYSRFSYNIDLTDSAIGFRSSQAETEHLAPHVREH